MLRFLFALVFGAESVYPEAAGASIVGRLAEYAAPPAVPFFPLELGEHEALPTAARLMPLPGRAATLETSAAARSRSMGTAADPTSVPANLDAATPTPHTWEGSTAPAPGSPQEGARSYGDRDERACGRCRNVALYLNGDGLCPFCADEQDREWGASER